MRPGILAALLFVASLLPSNDVDYDWTIQSYFENHAVDVVVSHSLIIESPANPARRRFGYARQPAGSLALDPRVAARLARRVSLASRHAEYANPTRTATPAPSPSATAPRRTATITIEDVASLPIESGALNLQPPSGWAYINKPVYFASEAREHELTATIGGIPLTITATPLSWRWDPGDGTPAFTTSTPGGPWPGGDATHIYTAPTSATISVEITWGASYTTGDGATHPIDGTLTTIATSAPLQLIEAETLLTG